MVERTYHDVVASSRYSYRSFVAEFDDWLDRRVRQRKPWILQTRICGVRRDDTATAEPHAVVGEAVGWPVLRSEFADETAVPLQLVASEESGAAEPTASAGPVLTWGVAASPLSKIRLVPADITTVTSRTLAEVLARRLVLRVLARVPARARPRATRAVRCAHRTVAPSLNRMFRGLARASAPKKEPP
jgi:hypothetical protein